MKKIDMSSEAITRRLRRTDQLRELSLSLMKAKKSPDEKKDKLTDAEKIERRYAENLDES